MSRQFQHIELGMKDALALREVVRPLQNLSHVYTPADLIDFCKKLYSALIDLEGRKDDEGVNIPLTATECYIINHCVGVEDWEGAHAVLRSTWAVLYELENGMPPSAGSALLDSLRETSDSTARQDTLS